MSKQQQHAALFLCTSSRRFCNAREAPLTAQEAPAYAVEEKGCEHLESMHFHAQAPGTMQPAAQARPAATAPKDGAATAAE